MVKVGFWYAVELILDFLLLFLLLVLSVDQRRSLWEIERCFFFVWVWAKVGEYENSRLHKHTRTLLRLAD